MRRASGLERAVMDALWDRGQPATGREITRDLAGRDLAYTTVMTVLNRLVAKQLVTRAMDGRTCRYQPVASREAYVAELMLDVLGLTDDRAAALTQFARSVNRPDAAALRRALADDEPPAGRRA